MFVMPNVKKVSRVREHNLTFPVISDPDAVLSAVWGLRCSHHIILDNGSIHRVALRNHLITLNLTPIKSYYHCLKHAFHALNEPRKP